jgi:hypothetical protein
MTTSFVIFNKGPGDLFVRVTYIDDSGNSTGESNLPLKPGHTTDVYCYQNQFVTVTEIKQ